MLETIVQMFDEIHTMGIVTIVLLIIVIILLIMVLARLSSAYKPDLYEQTRPDNDYGSPTGTGDIRCPTCNTINRIEGYMSGGTLRCRECNNIIQQPSK